MIGEGKLSKTLEFGADLLLGFGASGAAKKLAKKGAQEATETAINKAIIWRSSTTIARQSLACGLKRAAVVAAGGVAGGYAGYHLSGGTYDGMLLGANFGTTLGAMVSKKLFS